MSKFDRLPDRALELATDVGDRIRHAMPSDLGDRFRRAMPSRSGGLFEAGVAIGALKTGGRAATLYVRRNPSVAVVAIAGAGLLWYAAHLRAKKAERTLLEGRSRRVDVTSVGDERASETVNHDRDDATA